MLNPDRWQQVINALNLSPCEATDRALIAAYAEPQRHYHTARHIEDCLAKLDEARNLADDADEGPESRVDAGVCHSEPCGLRGVVEP
jgi:predicted metal-dependent HD superfamily phosphohydrolase